MNKLFGIYLLAIYMAIKLTYYGLLGVAQNWQNVFVIFIYNVIPLILVALVIADKKYKWLYVLIVLVVVDLLIFANTLKIALINEPIKITDLSELPNVITIRHSIYNLETKKHLWILFDVIVVAISLIAWSKLACTKYINAVTVSKTKNKFDKYRYLLIVLIGIYYLLSCYTVIPKQMPPFKVGYEPWVSEVDRFRKAGILRFTSANIIQNALLILDELKYTPNKKDVIKAIERNSGVSVTEGVGFSNVNVIFILVEALSKIVIDSPELAANSIEVTPFLKSLTNEALFTTNIFSARLGGATSECEFVLLASLMPPSHKYGYAYSKYMTHAYNGLPRALRSYGYYNAVFHAGERDFWHRVNAYRAFGFDRYDSALDYSPGQKIGLGLSDKEFLGQTAEKLKKLPPPFFAMLITLSSHYPYDGLPEEYRSDITNKIKKYPKTVRNYLESMHYVDASLKVFWESISDLRKNSIIVIIGDHNPAFYDKGAFKVLGYRAESNNDSDFLEGKQVPLVISVPDSIRKVPRTKNVVADQADVAPTLLYLLGRNVPSSFVGENIFSKGVSGTQFTNGVIHSGNVKYDSVNNKCFVDGKSVSLELCLGLISKLQAEEIITNDVIFGKRYSYEVK